MKKIIQIGMIVWVCIIFFLPFTPLFASEGEIRSSSKIPDLELQIPIDKIIHSGNSQLQSSGSAPDASARLPLEKITKITSDELQKGNGLGTYVTAIASWIVSAIVILAMLFIMVGGIVWLTAAGSSHRISKAKKIIIDSLWGLGIALGSYVFLATISPSLVSFSDLKIGQIEEINFELPSEASAPSSPVSTSVGSGICGKNIVDIARQKVQLHACVGACHCAWFVSLVLRESGCKTIGNNNAGGLEKQLRAIGWKEVPQSQRQAGDVTVWADRGHIAIYSGNGKCIQSAPMSAGRTLNAWCGNAYVANGQAVKSGAACKATFPSEQYPNFFNGSSCRSAQCITEFGGTHGCGSIYLRPS